MVFNSLHFLVFFMVVTLLFYRLKTQKGRIWLLFLSSCYFYMTFVPVYILILGATIIIDYLAGILIVSSPNDKRRKLWLILSVTTNVGILAFYKYFNFILENIEPLVSYLRPQYQLPYLDILLPIGLSFHTFQAMSYTIEVYRGEQEPERNLLVYSVYVLFYPQLVAGPIERPQNIIHQIREYREYDWENVKEGLARMLWGFFKKVVIADRVGMLVDHNFSHASSSSSLALSASLFFYYFQVYCDFSGYSDIALGAAKAMNINLMENFNQPILSRNISEFWRRWHISLYSWFYDYVFNPILFAFRNYQKSAIIFSLIFVFGLSGLWHGAAWHHVFYGLINGLVLVYEYLSRNYRAKVFSLIPSWLSLIIGWSATFAFLLLSRAFFRAETVSEALLFIRRIFEFRNGPNNIGLNSYELIFSLIVIIVMIVRENLFPTHAISKNKQFFAYLAMMVMICYIFGVYEENQFIYFQF